MLVVLAAATGHTGHSQTAQGAQPVFANASNKTAPFTNPSLGSRSAVPGLYQPDAETRVRIAEAYRRQPLGFEANRGQTDADVQFVSRGAGYTLFLTADEAVVALRKPSPQSNEPTPSTLLRMKLVDSNPAPHISQGDELPEKSNYIIGSDRGNWLTEIPRYAKVKYTDVYPGVDLVYYGNQRQLEYDFIVAPGADPESIELAFEGAQDIHVDEVGDLVLDMGDSEVRLKTPLMYQETDGHRVEIPGGYRKSGSDRIAFNLGPYDSTKSLVVDPILVYSTYLGGSSEDFALGIATDYSGAPYITGDARSIDFPTSGAQQPACATSAASGCEDAFVTKLGVYSTYFGGTSGDMATGIAVRPDTGEVYVTGWTRSPDFPTANAIDAVFGDDPSRERAFAAKLSSDGSELLYSTYLGGNESSVQAMAVAVDSSGAAYVTGSTRDWVNGPSDVFVSKLAPDGHALEYAIRFGGWDNDVAYGIVVDAQGYATVAGATDSHDFPQFGSPRPVSGGFAAKLVPDGSGFVYSTYLFGIGTGIAIAEPYTYVTGVMPGRQYDPSSPGGPGGGPTDAFVEVLGFGGQPHNLTHLGGTGEDRGSTIGVDFAGNIWVTGVTASTDFPLVNPLQGQVHGLDTFVVRLNPNLEPVFSTYLGGSGNEQVIGDTANMPWPPGPALAVDRFGPLTYQFGPPPSVSLAYIAGFTDSIDFPTAGLLPAMQPTTNGPVNSFVAWIVDEGIPTKPDLAVTELSTTVGGLPPEIEPGVTMPYLFEVTNKGPARAKNVTFLDKLPPGALVGTVEVLTPPSMTPYPRTCEHAGTWVACRLWTLSEGESVFVRIDVMPTTVGAQINTAAVEDEGVCPPATCVSNAFLNWFSGVTQDLVWGQDAGRDKDIRDNSVTTTTVVTPRSTDLAVTGSALPDVVTLDGIITYTLNVKNLGPAATAATLSDTLPPGTTLISATQTGSVGSCTGTNAITCEWPSLSVAAQVTLVVRATVPGTLTNIAVVSGASPDPNSVNNAVTLVTRVNRPPIANAGPDQVGSAGATCRAIVTLNGTGSSDPDGDTLTYTWTIDNQLPPPPPIPFSPVDPSTGMATGPTITGPVPPGVHTITLTVTDGFGGASSDTVVVTVRDATAPTFSGVPAPVIVEQSSPSGATVTMTMPIGLDNCTASVAVSSNAPALFPPGATTVAFTAVDAAGNSATATTRVTVVDTVSPTLAIASPQARAYLHSNVLTTSFSAIDGGSGLAAGMPTAALDGVAVANGGNISMLTLTLGTHSFVLMATDVAGNSRSQSLTFTVVATIDSLIASVDVFAGQNKIDDSNTVKSLQSKLNDAKQAAQRGNRTAAINKLQDFIGLVQAQSGKHVTADVGQILVADAQYVIGTL
jgi:uncharacterized repeat protein (TIGR01451 family)